MDFLHLVFSFVVALGLLITVHEFGHFIVAKRLGVKVLRFSVGFGRPLWSRRAGPDQTEYVVAAIPLGGYVKMLDEREGEVAEIELPRAFNRQPLWVRIAIVVAGPLFNFLFAILAYWLMFVIGISGLRPIVDEVTPGSPAALAGLAGGDEIVMVAGRDTLTWQGVMQGIIRGALDEESIALQVRDDADGLRRLELDLAGVPLDDIAGRAFFTHLGAMPLRAKVPPVIGQLVAGGAAERSGLKPGDRIVNVDSQPMADWEEWRAYVQAHGGQAVDVQVEREGTILVISLTPDRVAAEEGVIGQIGAYSQGADRLGAEFYAVEQYSPLAAVGKALGKTGEVVGLTLSMLSKMLLLEISVENLSGPISIAQYASHSAKIGLSRFLEFLAIVSISLGILNLLPIPILDGGHLMYYLIELFKGRPVSEEAQLLGQRVGIALLVALMGLAFYNDLARLFS